MSGRNMARVVGSALLFLVVVSALIALSAGAPATEGKAAASSANPPGLTSPPAAPTATPDACPGAYHYLSPGNGAPPNGGTALVDQQFKLEMMVHPGPYFVTVHQAYLTFTYQLIQNVSTHVNNCTLSSVVTPDLTVFDFELQNETCNGPEPCTFRGVTIPPGDMAWASGAWDNPPYNGPDFRVAEVGLCMTAAGIAVLHWQFSPPDPLVRDTEIVDFNSQVVSVRNCYQDYVINILGPAVTQTLTPTPTTKPTDTNTPTPTITMTPTHTATPTVTPCLFNFLDVRPTDYFYHAALYLYCHGVISGYSDYSFRPYNNTTRAQFCKIVDLAEGWPINAPGAPIFSDVPPNHPFYAYIMTALGHGVIRGYADGTFRPANSVTRAQLSKIIMYAQGWLPDTTGGPHFTDVPPTDAFYTYIETCYNHNIISGYADGTFRPGNNATRAQVCKIVYSALRP